MRRIPAALTVAIALLASVATTPAGDAAVVIRETGAYAGYTLLVPQTTTETHLLDLNGEVVHTWRSGYLPGLSAHLRKDGLLVRTGRSSPVPDNFQGAPGGQGGEIELLDWDSRVVGAFRYASDTQLQHHDAVSLPNGNVVFLAWDFKTADEAVAMGRDPALIADGALFPDSVVEVDVRHGRIVWEWHVWDHLVQDFDRTKPNHGDPAKHQGRVDLNHVHDNGTASWNHLNGIAYDPDRDHIVVSSRHFNELWVIDHRTTTKQARGRRGDLIGRFGNPAAYRQGTTADRTLFFQHNPSVISSERGGRPARFMVFNNGDPDGRAHSTVDEIIPVRRGRKFAMQRGRFRAETRQVYPHATAASEPMFANFISGAQRLPNGNLLVNDGPDGRVFEVTPGGTKVWEYRNDRYAPGPTITTRGFTVRPERLFTVRRYPASFGAFEDRGLSPAAPRKGEYSY